MTRWLVVLAAIALGSCNQVGADGYSFEKPEWPVRTSQRLEIVEYPSVEALQRAAAKAGAKPEGKLAAWGEIGKDYCRIHVLNPTVRYQPEWIGHEVTHCLYGRWHS